MIHRATRFAVTIGLFSCGGIVREATATSDAGATDAAPSVALPTPATHRPVADACPTSRPASTSGTLPLGGACVRDSDCTAGRNGRCSIVLPSPATCSYDECTVDGDCDFGDVCDCRAAPYGNNVCSHGGCRTDADCGPGGFCSPSPTACPSEDGFVGYFCHTARDTCVDDADCASSPSTAECAFDPTANRWQCLPYACAL